MISPRNIFLIDGSGAALSALVTGIILPFYSDFFGAPPHLLYTLALFPICYSIYSFSCFFYAKQIRPWMVLTIMFANIFYCFLSGAFIFYLKDLTHWGLIFFISEILVIFCIAELELKIYQNMKVAPDPSLEKRP